MSVTTAVRRLVAMDREELRFRASVEARKYAGRMRFALRPPDWRRAELANLLQSDVAPLLAAAVIQAKRNAFLEAHATLQDYFTTRASVWPLHASARRGFAGALRAAYPSAETTARAAASRVLEGEYDFLGYRGVRLGRVPDWHRDGIHERSAPRSYWASVPYLDPSVGDHKVIWEINRHQHWLTLGRGYLLTDDAQYRTAFISQLTDWIAANPPLTGINWASMLELAFRSIAWTWALEFFVGPGGDQSPWLVDLLVALDRQLTHVEQNLSLYFSPNTHLSGEALALYVVSLAFPELRRSTARAEHGRAILLREIDRQILPDGGHVERSAHYHRYSTDFYLLAYLVACRAQDPAADAFRQALRRQAEYLRTIADDRGELPLIGDDDGGQLFAFGTRVADAAPTLAAAAEALNDASLAVGPPPEAACWILGRMPRVNVEQPAAWPSRLLRDSGYAVSRDSSGSHLVFDVGSHGFLNCGHAHGDALSIVTTVEGLPLFVDPGTATYTMDASLRDRLRSARMHNTLLLDDEDVTAPAGPFRWERTADARVLFYGTAGDVEIVEATLARGPGRRHVRTLLTIPEIGWLIADAVFSDRPTEAQAWWHLHPAWTAALHGGTAALRHESGVQAVLAFDADELVDISNPDLRVFSPEYGRLEQARTLRTSRAAAAPFVMAAFVPARLSLGRGLRLLGEAVDADGVESLRSRWHIASDAFALEVDLITGRRDGAAAPVVRLRPLASAVHETA